MQKCGYGELQSLACTNCLDLKVQTSYVLMRITFFPVGWLDDCLVLGQGQHVLDNDKWTRYTGSGEVQGGPSCRSWEEILPH